MAKIKLNPEPVFTAKVPIPVAGGKDAEVEFTFKHRGRTVLSEWIEKNGDLGDVETIQEVATAWEFDDEFNEENIKRLCENYIGSPFRIVQTYINELSGARQKN